MKRLKYLAMAALVAFAACDEGDEVVTVPPPVTGSITGSVSIDGGGAAGVTVTLSNGATALTDNSGRYTFSDVVAGAYQVTISGFASDATFGATSAAATIASAGQVVTVDFAGSYIKTASIFGSVTGAGQALAGVTVTVVGTQCNVTTDAGGQFNCGGLRAGTYTVQIGGFDNSQYDFASTSQDVTVGVGESKVIAFVGTQKATSQITGIVSLDGTAAQGIAVTLSSGAATTTDATGRYSFENLLPGTYTVTISQLPNDASFSSTTSTVEISASGQVVNQDFAGAHVGTASIFGVVDIAGQGLAGVTVALSGGPSGAASATTDASGRYSFTGLRAGTYTVAISGYDTDQYTFGATSQARTLGVGDASDASFSGTVRTTSSISGTVSVEGMGWAGVTVSLGAGTTTTTDANGAYSFMNLGPSTYTVTISGAPADVAFPSASQIVEITAAQQAKTADFAGAYIRTAAISGAVTSNGMPLAGVTVAVAGPTAKTVTTDASGQYAATDLRAGDYTVTITNPDAARYNFSTLTANQTLAVGQQADVNFDGPVFMTATISGTLFIDENTSDDTWAGAALEPALTGTTGVTITLTGGDVATTATATVAADGTYSFPNLAPGNYQVAISTTGATGLGNYTFGLANSTVLLSGATTLTVGGTQTVNWPFNITTQNVTVQAFLGRDENASGLAASVPVRANPLAGVGVALYDTYANAVAAGAAGRLGTATTGADGNATFSFLRSADVSPQGGTDRVVFAIRTGLPAETVGNGETILEINYNATSATFTGLDAFDALNTRINMTFVGQETDMDKLVGWSASLWINDTTNVATQTVNTNTSGSVSFTDATTTLPTTYWVRLDRGSNNAAQPTSLPFTTTATAVEATNPAGEWLRIVHDGTHIATKVFDLGSNEVRYSAAQVRVGVHHERDETANRSTADDLENADNITAGIYTGNTLNFNLGAASTTTGQFAVVTPSTGTTSATYTIRARSTAPTTQQVLTGDANHDSIRTFTIDGSDSTITVAPLAGTGGNSAFAYKYNNGTINGTVVSEDATSTAANGVVVTLTPTAGTLLPGFTSRTTTVAGGTYAFTGLLEGSYVVSVADVAGTWQHRLNKFEAPTSTNVNTATETVAGNADVDAQSFSPRFMNTTVRGVVVNDRDLDGNVLDANEALPLATMTIHEDLDNDGILDAGETTAVATATTDATGAFTFSAIPAANYLIQAPSGVVGTASVLSGLNADGSKNRLKAVTTTAATTSVGSTSPVPLPNWNYGASSTNFDGATNFTFLFGNTTLNGSAATAAAAPVANMTITVRRCLTAAGFTSPPSAGTCTALVPGVTQNIITDASGNFSLTNLEEGVYSVTPNPVTAGFTGSTPASLLYVLVDTADIETGSFVIN